MHAFFRPSHVCLIVKNDTNKGMANTVCEYTLGLLCTNSPCSFVPLYFYMYFRAVDQKDVCS